MAAETVEILHQKQKFSSALCSRRIEEVHQPFKCVILQNRHQLLYFTFDVPSTEFKTIDVQVRYDACSKQPQLHLLQKLSL